MKTNIQQMRRGFTLVELLVVIVIIAALAGLTAPMVIRQRKKADHTQAVNNAKNIGLAMLEFEQNYGTFPGDSTAATVTGNTGTALTMGTSTSNDYFRQLIGAGISQSEDMFYTKLPYTTKPDNVFNANASALIAGEVGFGYLMDGTSGLSTAGNPGRPFVVAPLEKDNTAGLFMVDPFDFKGVALRLDGSVQTPTINKDKKMVLSVTGATPNLLETTGVGTIWEGLAGTLTFKAPLPKQ
jgi:prepilin-type N-terminal cleavage/methylation domain-containing protein